MFKSIFGVAKKLVAKRLLPFIAANIDFDSDTVVKEDGTYQRFRVEVFDFILFDHVEKISDERPTDNFLDIFKSGKIEKLEKEFLNKHNKEVKKILNKDSIFNQ